MVSTGSIRVIDNPAARVLLSKLRDKNTPTPEFRRLLQKAGFITAVEISTEVPLEERVVKTPLEAEAKAFEFTKLAIIAVLRAALPMVWGLLEIYENAAVGFISAKRREVKEGSSLNLDLDVDVNYASLPEDFQIAVIVDPMLATGSTMKRVVSRVLETARPQHLIVATLISTQVGIKRLFEVAPHASLYTFAIDPELNSKAFIIPGLGDAGDRAFNG
ncbi:MAG: uracil phosphoribosyltransferase [Infirmifilum sp.]